MKKTLIALVALVAATGARAAVLNWQTYTEDYDFNGGQAYLVLVTDAANYAVDNELNITGGRILDNTGVVDGTAEGSYNASATDFTDNQKYLFSIIVTSAGTGATLPTTGNYSVDNNGDNATTSGFYEMTWNANTGGSIYADPNYVGVPLDTPVGPIPEPSSAMLIALGLAAFGLKRKIA